MKINPLKNNNNIIINENYDDIIYDKTMNKFEKDLKIFGSYEFNDITDVIERHFILERCFSSYGLIKFSFLNVLAITRGINNPRIKNPEVISIMCDFCEKTKSLVRKYMNIYLNIFQAMKKNNKNECDEILAIIASHFKKTNMIPTEETVKKIKEFGDTPERDDEPEAQPPVKIYDQDIDKFIKEKGTFFEIHKDAFIGGKPNTRKKFDEVMKTIEALFFGRFDSSKNSISAISFDYKELEQLYNSAGIKEEENDKKKKDKNKFIPKTPLNLYASTNKLLSDYLNNNFNNKQNINNELLIDILSLLWYFKIPLIGQKWIESYKVEKDEKNNLQKGSPSKKNRESKIEKKIENDKQDVNELNEIIKKIIAVLIDLFMVIKDKAII